MRRDTNLISVQPLRVPFTTGELPNPSVADAVPDLAPADAQGFGVLPEVQRRVREPRRDRCDEIVTERFPKLRRLSAVKVSVASYSEMPKNSCTPGPRSCVVITGTAELEVDIVLPRSVQAISHHEVFTADEAAEMFERFYRTDAIGEGYELRPVEGYRRRRLYRSAVNTVTDQVHRMLVIDRTSACAEVRSSPLSKYTASCRWPALLTTKP